MSRSPTCAPQLASFAATERPSPRPAPVMMTACPARSCWMAMRLFQHELPRLAVAHDPARRRIAEVTADDQHLLVRVALDEGAPRLRALLLVHVEVAVSLRRRELDRVVHHVAGDDGFLAARLDVHAHVPRRMAGCRLEPY